MLLQQGQFQGSTYALHLNIDPPVSAYAIMRRASPYRGENRGPGVDDRAESLTSHPSACHRATTFLEPPGERYRKMEDPIWRAMGVLGSGRDDRPRPNAEVTPPQLSGLSRHSARKHDQSIETIGLRSSPSFCLQRIGHLLPNPSGAQQ